MKMWPLLLFGLTAHAAHATTFDTLKEFFAASERSYFPVAYGNVQLSTGRCYHYKTPNEPLPNLLVEWAWEEPSPDGPIHSSARRLKFFSIEPVYGAEPNYFDAPLSAQKQAEIVDHLGRHSDEMPLADRDHDPAGTFVAEDPDQIWRLRSHDIEADKHDWYDILEIRSKRKNLVEYYCYYFAWIAVFRDDFLHH